MRSKVSACLLLAAGMMIQAGDGFVSPMTTTRAHRVVVVSSKSRHDDEDNDAVNNCEGSVRANVNLGGGPSSDLSNRFKYKVNALMGTYDPADGRPDTERNDGNILGALVQFPTNHTFTVVGRTGDRSVQRQAFVDAVQSALAHVVGHTNMDADAGVQVTPRGAHFTKVSMTVPVDSADVVSQVHAACRDVEGTVMQF